MQAALAGHLLTGHRAARTLHETVGTEVITWLVVVQLFAALWYRHAVRGPRWPALTALLLLPALAFQISWGFAGRLALHVPVGTAFLVAQLLIATRTPAPASTGDPRPFPHPSTRRDRRQV